MMVRSENLPEVRELEGVLITRLLTSGKVRGCNPKIESRAVEITLTSEEPASDYLEVLVAKKKNKKLGETQEKRIGCARLNN